MNDPSDTSSVEEDIAQEQRANHTLSADDVDYIDPTSLGGQSAFQHASAASRSAEAGGPDEPGQLS
jgi:hypothetical protein